MSTERPGVHDDVARAVAELRLVDHHVHAPLRTNPSLDDLGSLLTESDRPPARGTSAFDSQVAFAVRRHCAPLLGLDRHASAAAYHERRSDIPSAELDRLFLRAAGVDAWFVDTGFRGDVILGLDEMAGRDPGASFREVVRLETVLEEVVRDGDAASLETRFVERLRTATAQAVGLKSVVAYRHGFDFDPSRPSATQVREAADRWLTELDGQDGPPRVADPVLLRMLLWAGVDTGLPLQLHAGYGDPDLDLRRCDPLRLTAWLKAVEPTGTDVMLLHCYPFHRQAGFLAQAFPHVYLDVGLALNYTGAAAVDVLRESLELAPFGKVLYSSDAWGPPELHYLGAVQWRRATAAVLGGWVAADEWSFDDAVRVATMIGRDNAARVYGATS